MKDFSVNNKSSFEAIQLRNIIRLISVLKESELGNRSLIEKRYKEQATDFDSTVLFLIDLGGLEEKKEKLAIGTLFGNQLESIDEKDIATRVLELILAKKSTHQNELFSYLSHFKYLNGEIEYRPDSLQRGEFSEVRNFLIEVDVVSYDATLDRYILSPEHFNLYAQASEAILKCTPDKLRNKLQNIDKIGRAAEKAVVSHEKKRVGPDYEQYVEHISLRNEAAGYDIKSVTIIKADKIEPRYIEVKAVSPISYRFFWTSNEMRVAEILGINYYLYLLPVKQNLNFSFEALMVISDPISEIIDSSDGWNVETNVVCCTLTSE